MKTMYKTKILCSIILLIVFLGACSTKKQLTSSSSAALAVDTATHQTAFQSLKPKPYYYPYFTYKLNLQPTPQPKTITTQDLYEFAFEHLKDMLEGNDSIDFEKAIFITENVYYRNRIKYNDYLRVLDYHTKRINALIAANDKSASMDFKVYANFRERGLSYTSLRYTESEKRELYRKALTNWAIFTYLTDTLSFSKKEHLPFAYQIDDPFGMDNWSNSQVLNLLGSMEKKGNCFALVALFKIFSNRLNSEAYICTAPQHIYLQHRDEKGDFYNLELATKTYPSDGTLMTLTFTHKEAIMSGISLRRLKNEKQNLVLCLVNLGKSYEHKFGTREDDFILKCAELALQHDSLNLNALLLKQQVLEEKVLKYASNNNITSIETLQTNATFKQLETHILHLYDKGYHQMPLYMQEIILSKLQQDNKPLVIKDRTPNPFTSIKVPAKNRRYSTLSGGLYEEVHAPKQLEEYGYFVLDTKNRKLVKFAENTNKELLIDPVVFAWQVDPMAHERTSWTPYNAFRNNPIYNIDPTGALDGDYYSSEGKFLGTDGIDDQRVYTTTEQAVNENKNTDGTIKTDIQKNEATNYIGQQSKFLNMQGYNITSQEVKRNLVGLSIFIKSENQSDYPTIIVTGGDRSAAKNAKVGGASGSRHISGDAADIKVNGISNLNLSYLAHKSNLFNTTIYYDKINAIGALAPHVHIDMKPLNNNILLQYTPLISNGKVTKNKYSPLSNPLLLK